MRPELSAAWQRLRRQTTLVAAILVWSAAAVAGMTLLGGYTLTAGDPGRAPARWPQRSGIAPVPGRANLVMSVHPCCPCSRASLAELARLMARAEGRLAAHVLFVRPANLPAGWERTGLWDDAGAIPGVRRYPDPDGRASRAFGARTSGQAALYDRRGRLAFSGGITPGRGHQGDSAGRARVLERLGRPPPSPTAHTTAVFGCSLEETP